MEELKTSIKRYEIKNTAKITLGNRIAIAQVYKADVSCPIEASGLMGLKITDGINIFHFYSESKEYNFEVSEQTVSFNEYKITLKNAKDKMDVNGHEITVPHSEVGYNYDYFVGGFEFS